jgi:hypothetical protein
MKIFNKIISVIRTKVNLFPSFKKIPSINTTGDKIVYRICNEISCLVTALFCFILSIKIRGIRIFNGGIMINGIEERFINFRKE